MGRYYTGDIEGKFWFGVQASDDASFFGGSEDRSHLNYYFCGDDLKDIEVGLKKCDKALGKYGKKMDKFFASHPYYNDKELGKALKLKTEVNDLLKWYARRILGREIKKCIKKTGECRFDAEI
jgi:hypothetical protein